MILQQKNPGFCVRKSIVSQVGFGTAIF